MIECVVRIPFYQKHALLIYATYMESAFSSDFMAYVIFTWFVQFWYMKLPHMKGTLGAERYAMIFCQ